MEKYLKRDVSWASFNRRVLDETDKNIPLGERLMFFGIVHSNLEEFFQSRYPVVMQEENEEGVKEALDAMLDNYHDIELRFDKFNEEHNVLIPLERVIHKGINKHLDKHFKNNVHPVLLPMTARPGAHIGVKNRELCIYVETVGKDDVVYNNFIQLPEVLDRFILIPERKQYVTLEELVLSKLDSLLKGMRVNKVAVFRVLRNAEIAMRDDNMDQYELIKSMLKERDKSWITMVEFGYCKGSDVREDVLSFLSTNTNTIILNSDLIGLSDMKSIGDEIFDEENKIRKLSPKTPTEFLSNKSTFDIIRSKDRIAFHPFDSFKGTFVRFIREAAEDPKVVSIKISLYRVAEKSEIIDALLLAAEKGKFVTVLIELKARFDEKHNIEISRILKEAGINIVYGAADLKTHAKICLVTRKEDKKIVTYSHIGTGNYNESNAKIYTDYSYFTADPDTGRDLTSFFNLLTSTQEEFKSREIIYAPHNMRKLIGAFIDEEIRKSKRGEKGRIIFKCNSLTDDKMANKLYEASQAGVKVILIVRGSCIIRPGVKGLSENITIYSIVGRFLEHSRIYIFGRKEKRTILIGSSDIMHRNLNTRNELLLRVKDPEIRDIIMCHIDLYLSDNVNRREILDNYEYESVTRSKKERKIDCHQQFIKNAKKG